MNSVQSAAIFGRLPTQSTQERRETKSVVLPLTFVLGASGRRRSAKRALHARRDCPPFLLFLSGVEVERLFLKRTEKLDSTKDQRSNGDSANPAREEWRASTRAQGFGRTQNLSSIELENRENAREHAKHRGVCRGQVSAAAEPAHYCFRANSCGV